MNEVNLKTGLRYAKFDHTHTRIRQSRFTYTPDWRWEYVELLRRREYQTAEGLRERATGILKEQL